VLERQPPEEMPHGVVRPDSDAKDNDAGEDSEKIQKLYAHLATVEALTPYLETTLARLRSLRHIHADAAGVREGLERAEKKAEEMESEMRTWMMAVETVEKMVQEGGKEMVDVGRGVESNIKGLEERVARLRG
jgi:nuclear migration protein JNM1